MSEAVASYDFEQLEPSPPPARDTPSRLLAEAHAEAEQIRAQARAAGREEGLAAGLEEGRAQTGACAAALGEALAGVAALRDEVAAAVERDAIELAVALAGKIVAGAQQVRPELVVDVVQGALRRVAGQRRIAILLNPADVEPVRAALGEVQRQLGSVEACDLQADQRVEAGGAIVRTAEGEVDARVATQLERAREVVAAELAGEAS